MYRSSRWKFPQATKRFKLMHPLTRGTRMNVQAEMHMRCRVRHLLLVVIVALNPAHPQTVDDTDTREAVNYRDFRSIVGLRLVGSARQEGTVIRLTPAKEQRSGGMWFAQKQRVSAGFDTEFTFQLTKKGGLGPGADGIAFVIQNNSINELAGRGNSGGFAPGDGYGDRDKPGIPQSIAVFLDTFQNETDPSDNHISVCTNGRLGQMNWPPARLGLAPVLPVNMKDGAIHKVRIQFARPILTVYLDNKTEPVLRAAVDMTAVTGSDGYAWVGFTASTGGGYENHDILSWSFVGERVESRLFDVSSRISYLLTDCIEGRNLCTPAKAITEEHRDGEWYVVLPAHLSWPASIPNPARRSVKIVEANGAVCFGSSAEAGCATGASAVVQKSEGGRTWFSVAPPNGQATNTGQGFIELHVMLN